MMKTTTLSLRKYMCVPKFRALGTQKVLFPSLKILNYLISGWVLGSDGVVVWCPLLVLKMCRGNFLINQTSSLEVPPINNTDNEKWAGRGHHSSCFQLAHHKPLPWKQNIIKPGRKWVCPEFVLILWGKGKSPLLPWCHTEWCMTSQSDRAFHCLREAGWLHSPRQPPGSASSHCWRWRPRWRSSSRRTGLSCRRWWPSWWRWSTCWRRSRRSCSRRSCRRPRRPTRRCCLCHPGPGGGQGVCRASAPLVPSVLWFDLGDFWLYKGARVIVIQ